MCYGSTLFTVYQNIFFAINNMNMSVSDAEAMAPFELELYQNMWVIEKTKKGTGGKTS